jgi:hypothetical protein
MPLPLEVWSPKTTQDIHVISYTPQLPFFLWYVRLDCEAQGLIQPSSSGDILRLCRMKKGTEEASEHGCMKEQERHWKAWKYCISFACGSRRGHFLPFYPEWVLLSEARAGRLYGTYGQTEWRAHVCPSHQCLANMESNTWGGCSLAGACPNPALSLTRSWDWLSCSWRSSSVYSCAVPWAARQCVVSITTLYKCQFSLKGNASFKRKISPCQLWDEHFPHQKHTENVGF